MSTLSNGDVMTRDQVLKFNPLWDGADRAVVAEDLDTFDAVRFQFAQSGYNRHVRVFNSDDEEVMAISPGTIYYGGGRSRPGSIHSDSHNGQVFRTSRWGSGGGQAKPEPALLPLCQTCWLHHAEGECDR